MKSLAVIYAEAREYLERHEWIRNILTEGDGAAVCAVGAVMYSQGWATDKPEEDFTAHKHEVIPICEGLQQAGGLKIPEPSRGTDISPVHAVTSWNDDVAEDKQQVIDLFAKAEKIQLAGFDPDAA